MGKSASFTCTLHEPMYYTVLNPKSILADTTHRPLYLYLLVTYANKSNSFIFLILVLKHIHSLKQPVLVHTLAILPVLTYPYPETCWKTM
jgi:hypothetical protein